MFCTEDGIVDQTNILVIKKGLIQSYSMTSDYILVVKYRAQLTSNICSLILKYPSFLQAIGDGLNDANKMMNEAHDEASKAEAQIMIDTYNAMLAAL